MEELNQVKSLKAVIDIQKELLEYMIRNNLTEEQTSDKLAEILKEFGIVIDGVIGGGKEVGKRSKEDTILDFRELYPEDFDKIKDAADVYFEVCRGFRDKLFREVRSFSDKIAHDMRAEDLKKCSDVFYDLFMIIMEGKFDAGIVDYPSEGV